VKFQHFDARTGLSVDCRPAVKRPLYVRCERCAFVVVASGQGEAGTGIWAHTAAAHLAIGAEGGVPQTKCLPTAAFSGRVSGTAI
jgi:hypothetical protein